MQTEHRFYRLVRPGGSGSFICPPGHPRHDYELHEYSSPRGRRVQGVFAVDYALEPIAAAYPYLVHQVQKIMDGAELVESEAWIRMVYGYFRSMYAPLGGSHADCALVLQSRPPGGQRQRGLRRARPGRRDAA